jgi:hypothetical protein
LKQQTSPSSSFRVQNFTTAAKQEQTKSKGPHARTVRRAGASDFCICSSAHPCCPPVPQEEHEHPEGGVSPANVLSSLEQRSPTASRPNSSITSLMSVSNGEITRWTGGAGGRQWLKWRNQAIQHNLSSICIWEKSSKCLAVQWDWIFWGETDMKLESRSTAINAVNVFASSA